MTFTREWAMPSSDTFSVKPIGEFVRRHLAGRESTIDPFAKNCKLCHVTNDLNPKTSATFHLDAVAFLRFMAGEGRKFDGAVLDPPYSPRQISECYTESGLKCGMRDTQNAALYKAVKDALVPLLKNNAIVLSFGWNSSGMGKKRNCTTIEIMLCAHGGAHNDTICMAEVYNQQRGLSS